MSFSQNPVISCDWPACYIRNSDESPVFMGRKATEIRARLKKNFGWTYLLGLDFCSHHKLQLPGHKPTLTKVTDMWGVGERPSCSCGWHGEQAAARDNAVRRWKQHLPAEDSRACAQLLTEARKARGAYTRP